MSSLTRIVPWSHQFLHDIIRTGDLVVDLTAGKGRDTLVLAKAVGPNGRVIAFDIQAQALTQTAESLTGHGFVCRKLDAGTTLPAEPGVYLVGACHTTFSGIVTEPIRACIANLGYLPGGNESVITRAETTCRALELVLEKLLPGGRLAVVIYPGHPGGSDEAQAVDRLFAGLSRDCWSVLRMVVVNQPEAPYLLAVEKSV